MLVAHVHGEIELQAGDASQTARKHFQEELELARELRNARSEAIALFSLSRVALLEGDTDDAAACLDGSLRLSIPLGEPTAFFECLVGLAEVAVKRGDMVAPPDCSEQPMRLARRSTPPTRGPQTARAGRDRRRGRRRTGRSQSGRTSDDARRRRRLRARRRRPGLRRARRRARPDVGSLISAADQEAGWSYGTRTGDLLGAIPR